MDWTLIVLSVAVAVSLVGIIWNIILTKNIEKRKYKYEILRGVGDWLESVMRCGGSLNLKFMMLEKVTPSEEKALVEEAVAQYYIISARVNYESKISELAGVKRDEFEVIENGIVELMEALNVQGDNKKYDYPAIYRDYIKPLNEKCSDLMGEIALVLGKEVKVKKDNNIER